MSFSQKLLSLKGRLPLNGDWLFVTETARREGQFVDVAEKYTRSDAVLGRFSAETDADTAKMIYERVKAYEGRVGDTANRVYDKAKVIFGTVSFSSTILLALGSTLLPPLLASSPWINVLGIMLACLLAVHLVRSLIIASRVMTREEIIHEGPEELIDLSEKKEVDLIKEITAKVLAYAIQTDERGSQKVNRLIIAQHSFQWAFIFFFILAVLSIAMRIESTRLEESSVSKALREIRTIQEGDAARDLRWERMNYKVDSLASGQALARREVREFEALRLAEMEFLRALDTQFKKGQNALSLQSSASNKKRP
ncbi:MAG TPA: hypothetical protein VLB76_08430 [Thermoanaerobaculia bacterium]|jgi:hypothetical protein|nr:hypothetical protein [Thermoanaerobaculia bacterium]